MSTGPQGQKRPNDVIENAGMVARIATGQIKEKLSDSQRHKGGSARADALTKEKRKEIAKKAAKKRWED